jgi:hypothetical protein
LIRSDGAPAPSLCIQVILVSTDDQHASLVHADLSLTSAPFSMEHVRPTERLAHGLEARIHLARTPRSTLVILDFESLAGCCEDVAARILALRGVRAVECLVTRSASDPAAAARLRQLGAFIADCATQPDVGHARLPVARQRRHATPAQIGKARPIGSSGPRSH